VVVVDVARPPLTGWRLVLATWTAPVLLGGLWAVQWWVTTPHETTYTEFRLMLLLTGVALPFTLCARWIHAAERRPDPRKGRR
jgi:hypothetical protein